MPIQDVLNAIDQRRQAANNSVKSSPRRVTADAPLKMHSEAYRADVVTDPGWSLTVHVGGEPLSATLWDGRLLRSPFAFDTETAIVTDHSAVPRLALLVASDGDRHVLVLPDQLSAFVGAQGDCHWIAHNLSFDYHVIAQHLAGTRAGRTWKILRTTSSCTAR